MPAKKKKPQSKKTASKKPSNKRSNTSTTTYTSVPQTKVKTKYDVFDLKKIALHEKASKNHSAAIDALTEAFSKGKRLAIKDNVSPLSRFPKIWIAIAEYVEIGGEVVKSRDGNRIKL
jgi:hypothetical protein